MKTRLFQVLVTFAFAGIALMGYGCSTEIMHHGEQEASASTELNAPLVIDINVTPSKRIYTGETASFSVSTILGDEASRYKWADGTTVSFFDRTFGEPGDYEFQVTGTNDLGYTAVKRTKVRVMNHHEADVLPQAIASVSVGKNRKAYFNNSSTNAVSFTWDFGDGSAYGTKPNMTHTYKHDGVYHATLTITDVNGLVASTALVFEVTSTPQAPKVGTLDITTHPNAAQLELDGRYLGHSNGTFVLPIGTYELSVHKTGYYHQSKTVTVRENETNYVEFHLADDTENTTAEDFSHTFTEIINGHRGLRVSGGQNRMVGNMVNKAGVYKAVRLLVDQTDNITQRDENGVLVLTDADKNVIQLTIHDNAKTGKVWVLFNSPVALQENQVVTLVGKLGDSLWVTKIQGSVNGDFSDPFFQ